MMAAFAELERDIIRERTRAGLEAAKAQGRTGGRPSVMNEDILSAARARRAKGESVNSIADALGVSRPTLSPPPQGRRVSERLSAATNRVSVRRPALVRLARPADVGDRAAPGLPVCNVPNGEGVGRWMLRRHLALGTVLEGHPLTLMEV